jgi:hypothetical protein
MQAEYCKGTYCPLKDACERYRENIDTKQEYYFGRVPYNHEKQKCEFQIVEQPIQWENLAK